MSEKCCGCLPLSVGVVLIGGWTAISMFATLAELNASSPPGLFLIAAVRALLLVAFSYAISNDSVKARRMLFLCYIAESAVVILN